MIERKLLQVAIGITTFAAEEGAEFKEVDVATWELKSRHHEQPVQPTAVQQFMYLMSRQENQCRDITTNSGKVPGT